MQVEWDSKKAYINLQKHGVHFSDAEAVLYAPNALLEWITSGVY